MVNLPMGASLIDQNVLHFPLAVTMAMKMPHKANTTNIQWGAKIQKYQSSNFLKRVLRT